MARESVLQGKITKFLRGKGCEVYVLTPGTGIPQASPDILFLKGALWGVIEVKKEYPYKKDGTAKSGAFRPNQEKKIEKLNDWSWGVVCWPENWKEIKSELKGML